MALIPSAAYPGQIAVDANYPQGKARDVTVSGDGTGTPLEQKWVNDLFGFEQALLAAGGVTPSGTPDSVAASDYLKCLRLLFASYASYTFNSVSIAASTTLPLTETHDPDAVYALASNAVQVPSAGDYKISVNGTFSLSGAGNPTIVLNKNGVPLEALTINNPAGGGNSPFAWNFITTISTPSAEKLSLIPSFSGGGSASIVGTMLVERLR